MIKILAFLKSKQNSRSAFVVGKGQLEEQRRFYDPFFFLTLLLLGCCGVSQEMD